MIGLKVNEKLSWNYTLRPTACKYLTGCRGSVLAMYSTVKNIGLNPHLSFFSLPSTFWPLCYHALTCTVACILMVVVFILANLLHKLILKDFNEGVLLRVYLLLGKRVVNLSLGFPCCDQSIVTPEIVHIFPSSLSGIAGCFLVLSATGKKGYIVESTS